MYNYQSRIRLGRVVLNVVNLDLQTRFYQQVLGLSILDQGQAWVELGIKESGLNLIRLEEVPASEIVTYGLYHFAILLPSRADLGDFLRHSLVNQVPLQGASDHGYSEAIYLNDTEGNGIEIYRDKPVSDWDIQNGKILGSKMEYMPVDCLQVPKVLFQMEKYKNLSNTAKILYSLFLDRLKFAVQNGWVDHNGNLFVIYPKSEIKKDLNTTRYGVDQAVQELVQVGKLVRIIPNNGKANHFYINGIYENEMDKEMLVTDLLLYPSRCHSR